MPEQTFLTRLQPHLDRIQQGGALTAFREKSWQRLSELGLPSKSHEAFRYVPLREFYLSSYNQGEGKRVDKRLFADVILPECVHSHLVFVDGVFAPELSDITGLPLQTVLLPLEDAVCAHGSFLQSHFNRLLKEETDPFAFVNLALHLKGAFIYLPPKHQASSPLQCLHIATGDEPQVIAPRLHLVLGSQSSMRCVFTTKELRAGVPHFIVPATEIFLEDGASLDVLNFVDTLPAWHFETLRAILKKNARLNSLCVTSGGKAVRHSYRVQLKGENSEVNLSGLWMLNSNRTAHTHAIVEHEAPHTRSIQRFKGILNDHSQSSFEGKILVRPEAQKTEAYQINNNLILSKGAIANSKPNLEIFADDVKASHGATVSQLDDEQLFYLNTRGIDRDLARRLLISGFCREMIGGIPYDSLLRKIDLNVETFLAWCQQGSS
jgi:Fe-S cluster assembly protein SufD